MSIKNPKTVFEYFHSSKRKSLATVVLCTAIIGTAIADTYPARPVRFIVPSVPGGSGDVVARILSEKLQKKLGQNFIIDNRPGAGTIIGTQIAAKAPPDGYTIILAALPHVINPHIQKSVGYDPVNDFAPVTLIGYTPMYLYASLESNVKTVKELIALAKSSPGKLASGSGGNGTATHLAVELLNTRAGISLIHAPYKGTGPALVDLAGGRIPFVFSSMAAATPMVKAGKIIPVAVANNRRGAAFPTVPTFAEAGLNDFVVVHWVGILAPSGTNPKIINTLHDEFTRAVADPETSERFSRLDIEPATNTSGEFRKFLINESARWGEVLKKSNLSAH